MNLSRFFARRRLVYLRDLLREMVGRDMKLRYKRSLLGVAWSLLNPLAQMLVFTFVFQRLVRLDIANYSSFVFIGVLVWNWFQASLVVATGAINDNRELVKRPGFPVALLPVISVTTYLVHFLLAMPILLVFLLAGGGRLGWSFLLLPAIILLQYLLTIGLGYFLAAINVRFRDVQHLLGVALMLLFYLTPIFYDTTIVPEKYRFVYLLNPMVHLIQAYRAVLIQASLPNGLPLSLLALFTLCLLGLGYTLFKRASVRFVEEL